MLPFPEEEGEEGTHGDVRISYCHQLWPHCFSRTKIRRFLNLVKPQAAQASMVLLKDRLIAQAQSKTVQEVPQKENGLCVGIVCVLMHAPRRSGSGKGNCVQSSFTFHLIGMVFLDLGSRHTDQPLISCSWQLPWCLLFIGQRRMDHVTRHIFTCCLGMWEDTQEDTD